MKLLDLLRKDNFTSINWIWHGGECLSVDKKWFDDVCFSMQKYAIKYNIDLIFSAQSNGTLLDDEWRELFNKYNIPLGVSYDWSAQSNRGYELTDFKDFYFIISVITNKNIKNLIQDFKTAETKKTSISYNFVFPTKEYNNSEELLDINTTITEYKKYFDFFINYKNSVIEERSVITLAAAALNKDIGLCNLHNCLLSDRICINSDGTLWRCDDTNVKEMRICHINDINNISEFFNHKQSNKLKLMKQEQINNYCLNCDLLPVCGQGCMHTSLTESQGIKPYSFQCEFTKEMFPYIYEKLGNLTPKEMVNLNPYLKCSLIKQLYLPAYLKEELKNYYGNDNI